MLRRAEFAASHPYLPASGVVIDLGAGSGLQTELLQEKGHQVIALDLLQGTYAPGPHMVLFDGIRLPLRASSVDAVFSSHVLEHVEDLPAMFGELQRVLRPGGFGVHIVPTATWRMLGMVTRWKPILAAVIRRLALGRPSMNESADTQREGTESQDPRGLIRSVLVPLPHGAHHSAVGEVFAFSRWGWRRTLREAGWSFQGPYPIGIAYSGTHAGPDPSLLARRLVARITGSSSAIWLVQPQR